MTTIYKVCPRAEWQAAEALGRYEGSAADRRDGFIHFSTAGQLGETVAKHFAGQPDLVLVAVPAAGIGDLRWEPSRGGALFPHLYGSLPTGSALWVKALTLRADGGHDLPDPG
jgi:uncharacterized protein (DUF952 family)